MKTLFDKYLKTGGSLPLRRIKASICLIKGDTVCHGARRIGISPNTFINYKEELKTFYQVKKGSELVGFLIKQHFNFINNMIDQGNYKDLDDYIKILQGELK